MENTTLVQVLSMGSQMSTDAGYKICMEIVA